MNDRIQNLRQGNGTMSLPYKLYSVESPEYEFGHPLSVLPMLRSRGDGFYLKSCSWELRCLCLYRSIDAHACQTSSDDTTWKPKVLSRRSRQRRGLRQTCGWTYWLRFHDCFGRRQRAYPRKGFEIVIRKNVDTLRFSINPSYHVRNALAIPCGSSSDCQSVSGRLISTSLCI